MLLENQVCTLEQAKKLKELGVAQNSQFSHIYFPEMRYRLAAQEIGDARWLEGATDVDKDKDVQSAYSVAELGVMLPQEIDHEFNEHSSYYINYGYGADKAFAWYEDNDLEGINEVLNFEFFGGDTEAQARANMLIYLLEKKIINVEDVNKRLNEK